MSTMSSARSRGFTLTEMLVVIGIIVMFIGVSLFIDMNNFRGNAFRGERAILVTLLQTARADSLNNIDQMPHGIALFPADYPNSYVLFEGSNYTASDPSLREPTDAQYPVTFTDSPSEVVFSQLSGNANYDGDIVMNDTQRGLSATISINKEGRISW